MKKLTRNVFKLTSFTLLLIPLLLPGCSNDAPEPIDLVITNVTLVDAVSPIRNNQTVLIDQGRIVDIVNSASPTEVEARKHVDGSGRYLIPGLWDFHVHFCLLYTSDAADE